LARVEHRGRELRPGSDDQLDGFPDRADWESQLLAPFRLHRRAKIPGRRRSLGGAKLALAFPPNSSIEGRGRTGKDLGLLSRAEEDSLPRDWPVESAGG